MEAFPKRPPLLPVLLTPPNNGAPDVAAVAVVVLAGLAPKMDGVCAVVVELELPKSPPPVLG